MPGTVDRESLGLTISQWLSGRDKVFKCSRLFFTPNVRAVPPQQMQPLPPPRQDDMLQIGSCPINRTNHVLSSVTNTCPHLLISSIQADLLAKDNPSAYLAPGSKMRGSPAVPCRPNLSSAMYPGKYTDCACLQMDHMVLS